MMGCATTQASGSEASAVSPAVEKAEPSVEELKEQVEVERHKLRLSQFEEFVNEGLMEMIEYMSLQVGAFVFLNPVSYVISEDGGIGIAELRVTIGGRHVGTMYLIAGHDGNEWKTMTLLTRTPVDQEPLEKRLNKTGEGSEI